MKKVTILIALFCITMITSCSKEPVAEAPGTRQISQNIIDATIDELVNFHGEQHRQRIDKGVNQAANL